MSSILKFSGLGLVPDRSYEELTVGMSSGSPFDPEEYDFWKRQTAVMDYLIEGWHPLDQRENDIKRVEESR
jgi:hypothetical protein